MAELALEGSDLVVRLRPIEKIGALSGDVRVPLRDVTAVRTTETPYKELRGLRVGTGIPFVIVLGRMIHGSGKDFVAIYGTRRTAVIELAPDRRYSRILVSDVAEEVVAELARRVAESRA